MKKIVIFIIFLINLISCNTEIKSKISDLGTYFPKSSIIRTIVTDENPFGQQLLFNALQQRTINAIDIDLTIAPVTTNTVNYHIIWGIVLVKDGEDLYDLNFDTLEEVNSEPVIY